MDILVPRDGPGNTRMTDVPADYAEEPVQRIRSDEGPPSRVGPMRAPQPRIAPKPLPVAAQLTHKTPVDIKHAEQLIDVTRNKSRPKSEKHQAPENGVDVLDSNVKDLRSAYPLFPFKELIQQSIKFAPPKATIRVPTPSDRHQSDSSDDQIYSTGIVNRTLDHLESNRPSQAADEAQRRRSTHHLEPTNSYKYEQEPVPTLPSSETIEASKRIDCTRQVPSDQLSDDRPDYKAAAFNAFRVVNKPVTIKLHKTAPPSGNRARERPDVLGELEAPRRKRSASGPNAVENPTKRSRMRGRANKDNAERTSKGEAQEMEIMQVSLIVRVGNDH